METFGEMLTRADHKARMDRRLLRRRRRRRHAHGAAARRHRSADRARRARPWSRSPPTRSALLEAVPAAARADAGYIFSKAQWLRREDKVDRGRASCCCPRRAAPRSCTILDEWWVERRLLARKLLDVGEHQAAYQVARDAAAAREGQSARRARIHRRLDRAALHQQPAGRRRSISPASAQAPRNPTTLARGEYWQGRAAEAAGPQRRGARALSGRRAASDRLLRPDRARPARARRTGAAPSAGARRIARALMNLEVVRAVQLLYRDRRARSRHPVRRRPRRQGGRHRRAGRDRRDRARSTTTRARCC